MELQRGEIQKPRFSTEQQYSNWIQNSFLRANDAVNPSLQIATSAALIMPNTVNMVIIAQ